ncbi:hypothetical protein F66182_5129 [Fusarium sp. NRRL 66182]|nr:hypothetical protein F66182_5129 [Fusarium sp. NRRL 66182]
MTTTNNIALITMSTRTPRVGPNVASLVNEIITRDVDATKNTKITMVDLADFNLPVFDEVVMPAMVPSQASFTKPHAIAWSAEIAKYDGYILVIPEYNYGLAGATKNAIDYLYNEWIGKGAVVVSYGIYGGNRASEQLAGTLKGMKLKVVETRPALKFHGGAGPDMFLAAGTGQLGEDTKNGILAETADLIKAFGELKDLLKAHESE